MLTSSRIDNNGENLAEAKKSIRGKIETFEMDVSKLADYENLKSKVVNDFGGTLVMSRTFQLDTWRVASVAGGIGSRDLSL